MAMATVKITGKVLDPSGAPVAGGTIDVVLSRVATTDNAGSHDLVATKVSFTIGADGTVDMTLIMNSTYDGSAPTYKFTVTPEGQDAYAKTGITLTDDADIGDVMGA